MDTQLGGDGDMEEKLLNDGWDTDPFLGRSPAFNQRCKFFPILLDSSMRGGCVEVSGVSLESGVFQLLDADKNVLMIKGVESLNLGLTGQLEWGNAAVSFIFEEAAMYTSRESRMMQAHLQ